jgi:uncharacterized small protein (DUF1192 family)
MTTFTTEDRENASPPHIVDSGASVKTLSEYVELEKRLEAYREEIARLKAIIEILKNKPKEEGIND